MSFGDLPVIIHQDVGPVAMQDARPAAGDRGRMLAAIEAVAGGLDAIDLDILVVEEGMEQTHGVGATTDRGDQR